MFKGPTGRERLLKTHETTDPTTFSDLLYCCALDIEDAMLTGGAKPGKDYQLLDVYQMALPIAAKFMDETTSHTTGIPSAHPHAGNYPVTKPRLQK